ncbi:MAG: RecX family transcriptional regulator [Candidatus Omnitrophica bacterium]|nr:RecX family transcriptional regulator [Candidatus Omnitrophota bacterium]
MVQSLKEKKLLDDYAFSKFWIENRLQFRPMARRHLVQELLAKGVDGKLIQEILQETVPQDEKTLAARLLTARFKQRNPKGPQDYRRMYGFLRRRGFAHETVSELLERNTLTHDDDE